MAAVSPRPWISTGGSLLRLRPSQNQARQSRSGYWTWDRSCGLAVAGTVAARLVRRSLPPGGGRRSAAAAVAVSTEEPVAGGQFIFWVADWFALMNDKMGGDIDKIRTVGKLLVLIPITT
eukprot:Skav229961  [mRNA]  locus=scaffold327:105435:118665:+ [translate_table: standard]